MIEFRNGSHTDLICRIAKVNATKNYFIYIEDAPQLLKFEEQTELDKDGWVKVESNSYYMLNKIAKSEF